MRKAVVAAAISVGALIIAGRTSGGGKAVPNETVPTSVSAASTDVTVPDALGMGVADARNVIVRP